MYDTTERVRRVKQTALRLIQKRERTVLRRLGTLCTVLALGLTGALAHFTDGAPGAAVQGAYGATLLSDSAGGYVLVASSPLLRRQQSLRCAFGSETEKTVEKAERISPPLSLIHI